MMKTLTFFILLLILLSCESEKKYIVKPNSTTGKVESIQIGLANNLTRAVIFDSNGTIEKQYVANSQGIQGELIEYYENGLVNKRITYKNDTLNGQALYYYKNGHLHERSIYNNNEKGRLTQYNRDGSKRGEVYLHTGKEYFKRLWLYDTIQHSTLVSTRICSIVNVIEKRRDDTLTIEFYLPLDNNEFLNSDFRLQYSVQLYQNGVVVNENIGKEKKFVEGSYLHDVIISNKIDSLIIHEQISYIEEEFEPCRLKVSLQKESTE